MSYVPQLPLAVQLPADETFATFVTGANAEVLSVLRQQQQGLVYLWGSSGVGKSHLLHALCAETQATAMYLPLRELKDAMQPQVLQGLEHYDLVCIDDVDAVTTDSDWCFELFALLNRMRDQAHGLIVVTAAAAPASLEVALADVHSRLLWGLSLQLQGLSDLDKAYALQLRAKTLGLVLNNDTAQFMVQRLGRNMRNLIDCLSQLDQASIAAKRRLTIPFVKDVLTI